MSINHTVLECPFSCRFAEGLLKVMRNSEVKLYGNLEYKSDKQSLLPEGDGMLAALADTKYTVQQRYNIPEGYY